MRFENIRDELKTGIYKRLLVPTKEEKRMILASKQPELLKEYYEKVSNYYTYFIRYYEYIKNHDITPVSAEVLTKLENIKKNMIKSYKDFFKKRLLYSILKTQDIEYMKCFENVMKMEDLITASIDLLEIRYRAEGKWYEDELNINIEEIYILKLEIDQYNNGISLDPDDTIKAEFKKATEMLLIKSKEKLEILKRIRKENMERDRIARIVPEPVHINNDVLPTHFRGPKKVRHALRTALPGAASGMPDTITAERQLTPSFPLPPPYPQSLAPTIQAAPMVSRASRIPRTSQTPTAAPTAALTLEELVLRTNALLNNAVIVPKSDIVPQVVPSPSPAIKQSQRPPLAPVLENRFGRRVILPLPAGAEKLVNYNERISPLTAIQEAKNSALVMPSRSHSFKSNSDDNDKKPEFDIEGDAGNPPKVYLIDNKDDGLCFLNAIFDYLLYSDKLSIMYERLLAIEELILGQDKYKDREDIKEIKKTALSLIGVGEGTYDLSVKKLIPVSQSREIYYIKQKEKGQLIKLIGVKGLRFKDSDNKVEHLGHPEGKKTYEERRKKFVISMKYVLALYILSYGKKKFINMIDFTLTAETSHIEWTENLRKTFKDKYKGNLDGFVYEYVLEYMINKDFFVNQTLIVMFKKILFKKIKDTSGKNIPRFWLEITTIFMNYEEGIVPSEDKYPDLRTLIDDKNNKKFERVLNKYRFKASGAAQSNKYIHTDNYDNYISLLCDEDRIHYLLFLLEEECKYDVVDLSRGGGKPKRPKTAAKPKRPKTATKPKRPKTSK